MHPSGFIEEPKELPVEPASSSVKSVIFHPYETLPFQMFAVWMCGSSIQIFSIGVVVMLLYNSLKGLSSSWSDVKPFLTSENNCMAEWTILCFGHFLHLALAMYSIDNFGLLPHNWNFE